MKLLLIEDQERTAAYLEQGLRECGHIVEIARTGPDGLQAAASGDHDLIILDVTPRGMDSFALLSALHTLKQTPVLVLTTHDPPGDNAKGSVTRADEYLVKPFEFAELLARVRALATRGKRASEAELLRAGDLEVDSINHRAVRGGQRIDLSAKEFALLVLLICNTGHVLSGTQIASMLWGINLDSDTSVAEAAIRRLRAKVDDPFLDKLIHTVRGVGYVLETRPRDMEPRAFS